MSTPVLVHLNRRSGSYLSFGKESRHLQQYPNRESALEGPPPVADEATRTRAQSNSKRTGNGTYSGTRANGVRVTRYVSLEEQLRSELCLARSTYCDRAEADEGDTTFDSHLNNTGTPTPVDRTTAGCQHRVVCCGQTTRLVCGAPGGTKRPERDGRGGKCGSIGRRGSLQTCSKRKPGVGHADRQDDHEAGDGQQQKCCRTSFGTHRSTRIAARAEISTETPPKRGAATR